MATAKLPIWRTTRECYDFVLRHPGDIVRIGWFPLILLFALSLGFSTYEPMSVISIDRDNPLADIRISQALIAILLQGAIATVMLVAWHRLVMKDYVTVAPATSGGRASGRRASVYFIQFLLLSGLALLVFSAAFLVAAIILHGIHFFVFDSYVPQGMSDDTIKIILGYVAVFIGLAPAFYIAFRLALALPATAVDRRGRFEQAWEASAGNGWRMVAATMLTMVPVEIVHTILTLAARAAAGTVFFYPLVLLASTGVLMLMVALGTVLSKCYAVIMQPARQSAPEGALAPAAG